MSESASRCLVFLLFLIPIPFALADGQASWNLETFALDGNPPLGFLRIESQQLLISKDCLQNNGKLRCAAFTALNHASLRRVRELQKGGAHPGALICEKLGGYVLVGENQHGDQNSFCLFDDRSSVSTGSLLTRGVLNDQTKK